MGLLFAVEELTREIQDLKGVADKYLDASGPGVLRRVSRELESLASHTGEVPWGVSPETPLRTIVSVGDFMPDGKGSEIVHAEISWVWHLTPVRAAGAPHGRAKTVELTGNASVRIRLMEGDPQDGPSSIEKAMWRIEVGDASAPGVVFHVQVLGRRTDPVFPHTVDVPRIPTLFLSPMACVEYVIGELFQDAWARDGLRSSPSMRSWRAVQARRLERQLLWQAEQLGRSDGSPWLAYKKRYPEDKLFLAR